LSEEEKKIPKISKIRLKHAKKERKEFMKKNADLHNLMKFMGVGER
jgi:hypothetical protein